MGKWIEQTVLRKEVQIANKYNKSLAIKRIQIKMIQRFHLAPVRMAIMQNTNNLNVPPMATM
jgi:hypothetical protein